MSGRAWRVCCRRLPAPDDRCGFPPLERAQLVELACLEPVACGLHITHWSSEDLAKQAIADGIVSQVSARMVRKILNDVDLKPHKTRYWKTSRLDSQFKQRAEKILWCYANVDRLVRRGIWVVCVDEMPNLQVLERHPLRRALPGSIEQQEFEYIRHGTVNLLMFLIVHTGQMEAMYLECKDADHYIAALKQFRRHHRHLTGIFLIEDGDPSHTAEKTQQYFAESQSFWRPRRTPVHASWLNQGELLNDAFACRYLKRESFRSRPEFIEHVAHCWPE
jgi:hypothetical protein